VRAQVAEVQASRQRLIRAGDAERQRLEQRLREGPERRLAGLPLTHRLARLPNVSRRSSRAFGPISGLLVDG